MQPKKQLKVQYIVFFSIDVFPYLLSCPGQLKRVYFFKNANVLNF